MGSMDSAFGGNGDYGFEPDDFYESFLAPKFHDFTAPEEPIDPDAYFLAKPGTLKKAFATVEEAKAAAPRAHKIAPLEAPKPVTAHHQQAPPKSPPVALEKAAVSAGSAKKASRVVAALVSPLTSKSVRNGSGATNSPTQPPMLEKTTHGALKPTSLAKKLQASENDDPNSPANNSTDVAAPKPVLKSALTRQRSVKAHEDKLALARQRAPKVLETKSVDAQAARKASGESKSSSESDVEKAPGKEKPVATTGAAKTISSAMPTCKVKEISSTHQEVKKPVASTEVVGSPYSGHHCKSSRCAANDPNFASPVAIKKHLASKRGTPGSLKKITPSYFEGEQGKEDAPSDDNQVKNPATASNASHAKVALDEVFQKMALGDLAEERNVTVTAVTELSMSEVKDLKEVPLGEETGAALSAADVRAFVGRSVNFEEELANCSTDTEKRTDEESKAAGIGTFLKVAGECLENIDLSKLDVPPSKQGKKRKSGELVPAGASKRANCTSDETRNKAISKKISQVKEAAASKIPNKLRMRRLSVAKRLSIARTSSRVTNPRPFRLRTQERGAMKEKEFIKKVEEYKAAKEGFHSAFQGLAVAEPKVPGKFSKSGHVFAAKRVDLKTKDEKEAEAKAIKSGVPPVHKAPLFDHPFKPHRSTKKLTVPQEPKFHTARGNRTCPSHAVAA